MPKQQILIKKPFLKQGLRSSLSYNCCSINGLVSMQPTMINLNKPHKALTLRGYRKTLDCNCNNGEYVRIFRDNCCKAGSVPKSATTKLSQSYCSTNSEYLKARCKTYDQHLYKLDLNKNANGEAWNCCSQNCNGFCSKSYYKPNNKNFSTQGGVSSGARVAQLKYNIVSSAGTDTNSYVTNNRYSTLQKQFPCKAYPKHHKNKCT
jgi:hypothetical protein